MIVPTISYDGTGIVTARYHVQPGEDFDEAVMACTEVVKRFKRSRPGSIWGCDGIGYYCQQKIGVAEVHNSGVGLRKFKEGLKAAV